MAKSGINWFWVGLAVVIIVLGVYFFSSKGALSEDASLDDGVVEEAVVETAASGATYEVSITGRSFVPLRVEVKAGDTVTFTNNDAKAHWPASIPAPSPRMYPGYDKSKCGSDDEKSIFDSCKELAPGESYSFTFTEVGNWVYWDRLIPSWTGSIIVSA